jgi:hypothetical protein
LVQSSPARWMAVKTAVQRSPLPFGVWFSRHLAAWEQKQEAA